MELKSKIVADYAGFEIKVSEAWGIQLQIVWISLKC